MANIFQTQITAIKPKALPEEKTYVYVPLATNNNRGIASFFETHFIVNNGAVSIRENDPTQTASIVKLDARDFIYNNGNVTINWPYAHNASGSSRTNGYGLMKIAPNSAGYLKYDENGFLTVDYTKFSTDIIDDHNNSPIAHPYIQNRITANTNEINKLKANEPFIIHYNWTSHIITETPEEITNAISSNKRLILARSYTGGIISAPRLEILKHYEIIYNPDLVSGTLYFYENLGYTAKWYQFNFNIDNHTFTIGTETSTNLEQTLNKVTAINQYNQNSTYYPSVRAVVNHLTTNYYNKTENYNKTEADTKFASLVNGKVPSSQLPSYVDDVQNITSINTIYATVGELPTASSSYRGAVFVGINANQTDPDSLELATAEQWATGVMIQCVENEGVYSWTLYDILQAHKIYVVLDTNKTYRFTNAGPTHLVEISQSLALGETVGTAYEGSKGKANADAIEDLKDEKLDKEVTQINEDEETTVNLENTGIDFEVRMTSNGAVDRTMVIDNTGFKFYDNNAGAYVAPLINGEEITGITEIELTGESGTLTNEQFAKVQANANAVVFSLDGRKYIHNEDAVNYVSYSNTVYPTTTTQETKVIYVNTSSEAVNYKHWNVEDEEPSGAVEIDDTTITKNTQDKLQAVGLTDGTDTYTLTQLLAMLPRAIS